MYSASLSLRLREQLVTPIAFGYPAEWSPFTWSAKISVFLSSKNKISMTEVKEERALLLLCIKSYLHWWYNCTGKELRTAVSKLPPLGTEKMVESKWAWWMARGTLEGEQWEVHLDQKGPAKFTTLLGVQWSEQCAYGCLTSPWNKIAWIQSTVQRLSRHQTVSQFVRRDKHRQLRSCLIF